MRSNKIGTGTSIVSALRRYGEVSADFLADHLHTEAKTVNEYLGVLESMHVVERKGDLVWLKSMGSRRPGLIRQFLKRPRGGFILPRSRCCNAPVRRTTGLITEICTKCNKVNPPKPRY